jgi:hypothetical protein
LNYAAPFTPSGVTLTVSSGIVGVDAGLPAAPVQNELFTPGFIDINAILNGLTPVGNYDLFLY